jgi:hypothetical protein
MARDTHTSSHTETRTTTDHEEIRRWVEEHGGKPAIIKGTESNGEPGLLTIDFPGGAGDDRFEHISWDEWFKEFTKTTWPSSNR